jgi:predicted metal-dependent enzyme (double-stranded beta helix superfamily)
MTDVARLREVVSDAIQDRNAWEHLVRHEPDQRVCELLHLTDEVELWLVCWAEGHDTGFHDHDHSTGLIAVIDGAVREERLTVASSPISAVHPEGVSVTVPAGDIHRVSHVAGEPAITLHAYSPPLERLGTYTVAEDGQLRRHPAAGGAVLAAAE